jgi:uncharacterized protein (DUF1800 family)
MFEILFDHLKAARLLSHPLRLIPLAFLVIAASLSAEPVNYESGILSSSQADATSWTTVNFTRSFSEPPVVVLGPATKVNGDPMVVRVRNVTKTGFQYQFDEWDYLTGVHGAETVHYFALSEGTHVLGTQRWQVGRVNNITRSASTVTLNGFNATPVVLTQIESTENNIATNNPRALKTRISNVSATSFKVNVETQQSYTSPINGEKVAYIAVSAGTGYLDGKVLSAVTTSAGTTQAFGTINFPATRNSPILIAQTQTKNDSEPGELRMQSLTSTSVQLQFQEETSSNTNTSHSAEVVGYIVLGNMSGETAAKIEVGDLNVTQSNASSWKKVNLEYTYSEPIVVMGPLSKTSGSPLTVRVRNVLAQDSANAGKASFEFRVDRWRHINPQEHDYLEHISYIAMEAGTYAVGGVLWQAGTRNGVTKNTTEQTLSGSFQNTPAVFSQVVTVNDSDECQSRVSAVTSSKFNIELDESEIDTDSHAGETVHWVAITKGTSNFFSSSKMRFQVGQVTNIDSNTHKISFSRFHADPFLFASLQTKNDGDPATLRWSNLFADRVQLVAQEDNHPPQFDEDTVDNSHDAETTAFLVIQGAQDNDEDGAPDSWETSVGLDPTDSADGSADPDGDLMTNQQEYHNRLDFATSSSITSFTGGVITVDTVDENAYELNNRVTPTSPVYTSAQYRIKRRGGLAALTIKFSVAGTAATDEDRAPASNADYDLWTANNGGTQLDNSIQLNEEALSADIYVRPVDDGLDEYTEGLRLTLNNNGSTYVIGSPSSSVALINDAKNIPANERLFVGTFLPQASSGAVTSASGFATVILNGSNNGGRISTTFSGLTTPQSDVDGSHVHYANGGAGVVANGTIIFGAPDGLPKGQLVDYYWKIKDAAGAKAQDIINALYRKNSGVNLYINVHTDRYSGGEIRADLTLQTGSASFTAPAAPPALENLASDAEVKRDCSRFLTQATFGPSEDEINQLFNTIASPKTNAANRIIAFNNWIDGQLALDQTTLYDYLKAADEQEWVLHGQQPNLPAVADDPGTPDINESYPAAPPPGSAVDWTRWGVVPGTANAWTFRPIPPGILKDEHDPDNHNRRRAWWLCAVRGHDQLRQRVAFALEQIFVVSDRSTGIGTRAYGHARYYDMLADFVDGIRHIQPPDTTYSTANGTTIKVRELLEDVTKHPIMGKYLSHLKNRKAEFDDLDQDGVQDPGEQTLLSPDENYAREIMQLFSIGLLKLHPDGSLKLAANGLPIATYGNEDIKELSKVFTGYSFAFVANTPANEYVPTLIQNDFVDAGEGLEYFHPGYENPMKNFVAYHDEGEKNFLSTALPKYTGSSGDTAARKAYAESELDTTMGVLFNHQNIAPFLSRLLIQRLVTSNPSRGYVYRVAQAFADSNGAASGGLRGYLPAVIKAILLDYEARSLKYVDPQTVGSSTSVNVSFGKVKEPIIRYTHLLRAFGAKSQLPVNALSAYGYPAGQLNNLGTSPTRYRYPNTTDQLSQTPNNMPSVFNWYLPDYTPGGRVSLAGMVAPELQIMTESTVVRAINFHRKICYSNVIDASSATLPEGQNGGDLVGADPYLDNIFLDISALVSDYIANRQSGNTEVAGATYLVDRLDKLLCSGALKAKYPNYTANATDPRSVMIDQLATISVENPPVSIQKAANRVRAAIYLITSSPEFIVQK